MLFELTEVVNTIPSEIKHTLKALADEDRLGLILLLLKNGEMSFSELQKSTGMHNNNLTHHLKVLTQAALLYNYYMKKDGTADFSYYEATEHARDCIDAALGMFQPKRSATQLLKEIVWSNMRYEGLSVQSLSIIWRYTNVERPIEPESAEEPMISVITVPEMSGVMEQWTL